MPEDTNQKEGNFFTNLWQRFENDKETDRDKIEPEPTTSESANQEEEETAEGEKNAEEENAEEEPESALETSQETNSALQSLRERQESPRQYPPSPIKEQKRELKGPNEITRDPLEIVFLTGKFQGKKLNLDPKDSSFLGTGINEISQEQSAEWDRDDSDQVRSGANFKRISPRSFSMEVVFYDEQHDVSHLVEQLAAMQEVDTDLGTPPLLHITQGHMELVHSVCTRISSKYKHPLLGKKGFHWAQVDLSFEMYGGKGSPQAYAPPLSSTPLGEITERQSATERNQEGSEEVAELLLGDCLGDRGKKALNDILQDGGKGLHDPEEILNLPSDTRLQLAIAGSFPDKIYQNEKVRKRLREDLAAAISQAKAPLNDDILQTALLDNNPDILPTTINGWHQIKDNFDLIWNNLKNNNLGDRSDIHKPENKDTFDKLVQVGGCGLQLRQAGGLNFSNLGDIDADETVRHMNNAIDARSDSEIKELFGLESQTQVDALKDGHPYKDVDDLIRHFNRPELGVNAFSIVSAFRENTS